MADWRDRTGRDFELPSTPQKSHEGERQDFTLTEFLLTKKKSSPLLILVGLGMFIAAISLPIQAFLMNSANKETSYLSEKRFDEAEQKFEEAEQKLNAAAQKQEAAEQRFEEAEQKLNAAAQKQEAAEQRFEEAEQKLNAAAQKQEAAEQRFEEAEQTLREAEQKLGAAEQVLRNGGIKADEPSNAEGP